MGGGAGWRRTPARSPRSWSGCPRAWAALAAEAGAAELFAQAGLLHVWRRAAAMRDAAWAYDLRRRLGVRVEELDAGAARAREPALQGEVAGGRFLPDVPTVTDPLELTRRLVARFVALGGAVERAEASAVVREGDRVRGVRTAGGDLLDAELVVLAAGAWSARLARPHGARGSGRRGARLPCDGLGRECAGVAAAAAWWRRG